jgi:hypothetical protein
MNGRDKFRCWESAVFRIISRQGKSCETVMKVTLNFAK